MLSPATHWNEQTATHLLSRAGFGGTPLEISAAIKLGRAATVGRLLATPPAPTLPKLSANVDLAEMRTMADEVRKKIQQTLQQQNRADLDTIRGWWISQMIQPSTSALEKATLFWHGHFATSVQKVRSATLMFQQNQLFRRFAFGNFRDMVKAISCDPAMVIWLDLQQSKEGAPNENFARELMELFTLGIGHYSEDDIKNSARAFTGYRARPLVGQFDYIEKQHDDSEKVFMEKKGKFSGDDIIDIIFQQPACAHYICEKLWIFYASEDPDPEMISSLAHTFRQANYELRPVLSEMFNSKAFYSAESDGTQIKSPTQLIVQSCKILECDPPPGFALQFIMQSLGQVLFAPPNVKGWDGNRAWINTSTLASRGEFTDALTGTGKTRGFEGNLQLEKFVTDEMINDCPKLIDGLTARLLVVPVGQSARAELIADAEKYSTPLSRTNVRNAVARILRLPEYQLT